MFLRATACPLTVKVVAGNNSRGYTNGNGSAAAFGYVQRCVCIPAAASTDGRSGDYGTGYAQSGKVSNASAAPCVGTSASTGTDNASADEKQPKGGVITGSDEYLIVTDHSHHAAAH